MGIQLRQQPLLALGLLRQLLPLYLALGQRLLPLLDVLLQKLLLSHQAQQNTLGVGLLMGPGMAGRAAQRARLAIVQLLAVILQTLTGMGLLQLTRRQRQLLAQPQQLGEQLLLRLRQLFRPGQQMVQHQLLLLTMTFELSHLFGQLAQLTRALHQTLG